MKTEHVEVIKDKQFEVYVGDTPMGHYDKDENGNVDVAYLHCDIVGSYEDAKRLEEFARDLKRLHWIQ